MSLPYQVSTSYTLRFLRYSPYKIFKLKITMARSNQGQTMMLHTCNPPKPMSLPSINFLHLHFLTVSEIQPRKTFSCRSPTRTPAHPDTMGENNTPTALKGCGVKTTVSYEVGTLRMHNLNYAGPVYT